MRSKLSAPLRLHALITQLFRVLQQLHPGNETDCFLIATLRKLNRNLQTIKKYSCIEKTLTPLAISMFFYLDCTTLIIDNRYKTHIRLFCC